MENLRFKDVPTLNVLPMTFAANEKELAEWLSSLSVFPNELAAEKILQSSHAIAQMEGKGDIQIRLIQKILQHFHVLAETMQKTYLDASQPLDKQPTQQVELVVWNYMKLARTLLSVVRLHRLKLTKESQVIALYLCLEALNHAQLHMSLSYRIPMEGFWLMCYEAYRYAEHSIFLSHEVNRRGYFSVYNSEDSSVTIEKAFKQLLVFYLTDTQQFRSRDMIAVFQYLTGFSTKASILSGYQQGWKEGVCVFNLNLDNPPQRIFDATSREDTFERFVAPISVAKGMYETMQQKSKNTLHRINYEVLLRAVNSLGLGRKRKFKRITHHSECSGILGLTDLIAFLQSKTGVSINLYSTVRQVEKPKPLGVWQTHEFDLVPTGEEAVYQMQQTYKNDIRLDTHLGKLIKLGSDKKAEQKYDSVTPSTNGESKHLEIFEMQDSSAKGYGLLTNFSNTHVKIGDVLGLIKANSQGVEIGLIRRINHIREQRLRLGVEMISFESELVFVTSKINPSGNMWALFLPGVETIKQPDSLVYSSSLLKEGEVITIQKQGKEQPFRLQRILQVTSAVVHVELQGLYDN